MRVARFAGMIVFSVGGAVVLYFEATTSGHAGLFPWAMGLAIAASPLCAMGFRRVLAWDESTGSRAPAGALVAVVGIALVMGRAVSGTGSVWLLALWTSFFIGATGHFAYEWFIRPLRVRRETAGPS